MNRHIGSRREQAIVSACFLLFYFAFICATPLHAKNIQLYSVPNSKEMTVVGINASDTIAGACYGYICGNRSRPGKGYIRTPDGTVTVFKVPHAKSTVPEALNDAGAIIGDYTTTDNSEHGFLRSPDGAFTILDPYIYPAAINNRGVITGAYFRSNDIGAHGFVRSPDGRVTAFDPPGATEDWPTGINARGTIAGLFADQAGVFRAYIRATDGSFTIFDVPDSIGPGRMAINDKGIVAGPWEDSGTFWHSFVRDTDGTITTFDVPNSVVTEAEDINARGDIVGYYIPDDGKDRGFLRAPDGKFTSISSVPKPVENAHINRYGVIAGAYGPRRSVGVGGFIREP